jgi:hypothetical protein
MSVSNKKENTPMNNKKKQPKQQLSPRMKKTLENLKWLAEKLKKL